MITNKQECKDACTQLLMQTGTLKNNKPCYRAGNGKCRQDGRYKVGTGTKTSPICKNTGKYVSVLVRMVKREAKSYNKFNVFISNLIFIFVDS